MLQSAQKHNDAENPMMINNESHFLENTSCRNRFIEFFIIVACVNLVSPNIDVIQPHVNKGPIQIPPKTGNKLTS